MNEKELAEIEERAAKATEGRWIFQKAWATSDILDNTGADIAGNVERRNANFIAHARQDVPALVAEVRRLKAENANIRMINEQIGRDNGSLREENARLRAALGEIKDYAGPESQDIDDGWSHIYDLASDALKGDK